MKNNRKITTTDWLIIAGLLLLSLIPAIAGAVRMATVLGGAEITPENARFISTPLPILIHIVSSMLYAVFGAFQFPRGVRHRWPKWHRWSGRLLIPAGFAVALSGLWMTLFYPWPDGDGIALYTMRLIVGTAMLIALVIGVEAVRRYKFAAHGAWMLRAYALAMGAGTQVFTQLPLAIAPDLSNDAMRALTMGAGWLINILIAELVIRRKIKRQPQRRPAVV